MIPPVKINITVNEIDKERLKNAIRSAVSAEIMRQQRPGRILSATGTKPSSLSIYSERCLSCVYFLPGYRPGEEAVCNAFHAPMLLDKNECADWESILSNESEYADWESILSNESEYADWESIPLGEW